MASDTRPRESRAGRLRRAWTAVRDHLSRIRYRLLLINLIVVAVPIVGISFARTFESEMLHSLELDMIHQAQLLRVALADDRGGLRLAERSPMLARAARDTRTRIRLLDERGEVVADSHAQGPPEGAEQPVPDLFGRSKDSYHPPERPRSIDVSTRREIRLALRGRYGSATRLWENRSRVYLFSALPIRRTDEGPVQGVVYVTRSTAPVKLAMNRLRTWLFIILIAAIAVTAILSLFLAATISRPLGTLTRIAQKIAAGDRRQTMTLDRRDEIGQLARAFDTMTERLDERARYTSELAANISHEFKSPLTSIRGAAELLIDGAADDLPARGKFLGNILEDTHRLDRLVTRLLELSRFESDTTPPAVFDYEALVRDVIEQRRESADVQRVTIEIAYRSKVTHLNGRRGHIASALNNLIDNACQHAEPDSKIQVTVTDGAVGIVRTSVGNRGSLISQHALTRVWERFYTTRGKQGGTGLGLAIVSAVVAAHGGTIDVLSTTEDGTVFSYELPVAFSLA